jgi:hypothetical protein
MSEDDEHRVVAGSSFHIAKNASEKSNHMVIEHIDELQAALREQPENEADKVIPVFNELDIWQPYTADAPIKHLSLYIVEVNPLDLFCNIRGNLCHGLIPEAKQAMTRYQGLESNQASSDKCATDASLRSYGKRRYSYR